MTPNILNSAYVSTAGTSMMTPTMSTVPASAFSSLSNGLNSPNAGQMVMTPSGQMLSNNHPSGGQVMMTSGQVLSNNPAAGQMMMTSGQMLSNSPSAGQVMMTASGQVLSSLPAGYNETLSNRNLLLSSSPTLVKEDMTSSLQMIPLSFSSTSTVNTVVNGGVKIDGYTESSFSREKTAPKDTNSDVTMKSEVRISSN